MAKKSYFKFIKYKIGNFSRTLSSPWLQMNFKMESISNIFASSFGSQGWHPIIKTLQEYDSDPSIDIKKTSLWMYHKNFLPTSISMFLSTKINTNLPTFIYPWGSFNEGSPVSKKNQELSRFCGPSSDQFIEDEYKRIIFLYESLKSNGYTPKKYPHSYIGGTILKKNNGETRFVVMQGNHRTAIFSHLGYKSLEIRLIPNSLKFVYEKNLSEWVMVKNGMCSEEEAIKVFNLFFEQNGKHITDYIKAS
jgi:hypothetical protein